MNILLWILQILLGLLFVFGGVMKFFLTAEQVQQANMSVNFLRFIGVCELWGGLGLLLPGLFRIRTGLTVLAAIGLAIIMVGAVATTISGGIAMAIFPLVCLLLLAFIAYGRWKIAPLAQRS
jgi:putative oxidoreductase